MIKAKLIACVGVTLAVVFVTASAQFAGGSLAAGFDLRGAKAHVGHSVQNTSEAKPSSVKAAKAILGQICLSCHGESAMSDLDLRTRDAALKGGTRGPAIVPGKAEASLLYLTVAGGHEVKMPPGKQKLSDTEVKTLRDWINEGASWDEPKAEASAASSVSAASSIEHAALAVLAKNCYSCHAAAETSGLDLRSRETALKGGTRGPAIVPGKPEESLLFKAISGKGELKMPPGKTGLPDGDVKTLHDWIAAGAKWPAGDAGATELAAEASWWSFKKPARVAVPAPKNSAWVKTPVDAFVLHKLEEKNLTPAPPADKGTLIRRAYFDLTGLPPTPEQVKNFVEDGSPDAYEKLVDGLLASPRYGERWGRHWLDVVRYADTGGFENDLYYKNAWRYRDYVVKSFNEDKPYDQFVQEQIAADEIWPNNLELEGTYDVPKRKQIDLERRIGTSLYTIGPYLPAAGLIGDYLRSEKLADMADVTSAAFMGLTMSCARCHDHKFDPIPQKDYYRLQAVFAASEEKEIPLVDVMKVFDHQKAVTKLVTVEDIRDSLTKFNERMQLRRLEAQLPREAVEAHRVAAELRSAKEQALAKQYESLINSPESKKKLKAKIELTAEEKAEREKLVNRLVETVMESPEQYATANVLGHVEDIPDVHVALRGEWRNKGAKVGPGFPSAISDGKDLAELAGPTFKTRRRKDLALWLTRPDHPLTARVMVNRIWQGHFGWGIVRSPNDFGRQGEAPTHPELLDWLSTEFVAQKWSVKAMHRLMMLSNAYRMSNRHDEGNARVDGDNRYLWRMNRRRLEAEAVRDAVLAVAGNLNLKMGGVPVVTTLNAEEMDGVKNLYQWNPTVDPAEYDRRGIYLYVKRGFRYPFFEIFDSPDSSFSCPRRDVTNVAPQALALLNNDFVFRQSEVFAARLRREHGDDPAAWVEGGWRLALGRAPTAEEKNKALEMFAAGGGGAQITRAAFKPGEGAPDHSAALTKFCLMLYNLNEFVYVD